MVLVCSVLVCVRAYRDLSGEQSVPERQLAVVALAAVEALVVLSLTNDLRSQLRSMCQRFGSSVW